MSVNRLGMILFSGFLIFATAPLASAQQNTTNQDTTTKKQQTQKKSTTASKDQSTTGDQSTTVDKDKQITKKSSSISHAKVREMQSALKKDGFDPGPIDGVMGVMTMTALHNYQLWNHLESTGTLTAETENSLMKGGTTRTSSLAQNSSESSQNATSQNNVTNQSNVTSDRQDVQEAQQALSDLGYDPGEINGMMSSNTQEAIRQFQWFNSLPVTGTLDESTKTALDTQERSGVENAQLSQTTLDNQEREKPGIVSEQTNSQETTAKDEQYSDHDKSAKHHEHHASGKTDKDASERVNKAATVLQDLTSASDKRVPDEILQRAEAIAVIPHMVKGAFGVGGRYGKGVVAERAENGRWSSPAFIEIGGGSFGAQLGVEATDLVLVFTDRKAMDLLENGKDMKLGVDAGLAAGPIGREAEAGVNANLKTAIYAYSRNKGLFAGIALDGAVLNMDKSMNEKVYGSSVDAKRILNGNVAANSTVQPFMIQLDKVVPKKRISQK